LGRIEYGVFFIITLKNMEKNYLRSSRRVAACCVMTAVLVGCASQSREDSSAAWAMSTIAATQLDACRETIARNHQHPVSELDSGSIQLLNWNMQKVRHASAMDDLNALSSGTDLILIQEATLRKDLLAQAKFWSFAPGYRSGEEWTGVMTMSATAPLTRCNLTNIEPWLGTPKATSITEYALSGTDATLVVVNIHAVNFTFGIKEFREQLEQIPAILNEHSGPVILSGDFNTWRQKRLDIVSEVSDSLGLEAIEFEQDQRKLAFGNALDHVYVRGLSERDASTRVVSTSDHNPMMVSLSL